VNQLADYPQSMQGKAPLDIAPSSSDNYQDLFACFRRMRYVW
jgi:hypothetical protein